jgi:hypothetical protein
LPKNAESPIILREAGNEMLVILLPINALSPILVSELHLAKLTTVRFAPRKASAAMLATDGSTSMLPELQ